MHAMRFRCAAWALTMALVSLAGGCGALDALGLARPTAKIVDVALTDLSPEAATLRFDVDVANPYSVPLPLTNLDYALASRGAAFLTGQGQAQGTIPARSSKTVPLTARVPFARLLSALKGVRPGQVVPYDAELGLSVDAPAVGPLRLPLKRSGQLPVPAPPKVDVPAIRWQQVDLSQAVGVVTMNLTNPNSFPVDLKKIDYALNLAGVKVAESQLARAVHFDADGGTGALEIPVSFSPKQAGLALLNVLRGAEARYDLTGLAEGDSPFGPISLPLQGDGQAAMLR